MTRTLEKRQKNTEYARQLRARKVAAANMDAVRCRALLANHHPCNTPLQSRFVDGETVPFCPTCEKKARGICIECEAPVQGARRKALRCALHKKLAHQASLDRYKHRNKAKLRRKEQRRMSDPAVRADRIAYKKLYRRALPSKTAAYKKAYTLRNAEKVRAYQAAYREKRREERAAVERARNAGTLPPRACLTCPTIITGRAKRCAPCKEQDRRMAREIIAARPGVAA